MISKEQLINVCKQVLILIAIIAGSGTVAHAQSLGDFGNNNDVPNTYSFVRVGEPHMEVVVIGTVQRPGSYRIREGTDLSTIFMYAGGASTIGERRKRNRPDVTLQISRKTDSGRQVVFTTDFESMISRDVDYPVLQREDIILVETVPLRPRFRWYDAARIVSALSTTLLIIDRFIYPLTDNR
ncbi:MAG: hypothetical protein WD266_07330 [Balneolales bacterium]